MFTARYGLSPCIKQITFSLLKVNAVGKKRDELSSFLRCVFGSTGRLL